MIKFSIIQASNDPAVSQGYETGYQVGLILGKILPFLVLAILIFFVIRYSKKRKNK